MWTHTSILEHKVRFQWKVLLVDTVLAGSVPVKLNKLVGIVGGGQGPVAEDNFEPSAQIFELCALCWWNSNADVALTRIGNTILVDINW